MVAWVDKLTVPKLKDELKQRNLPLDGLKAALKARLLEALEKEEGGDVAAETEEEVTEEQEGTAGEAAAPAEEEAPVAADAGPSAEGEEPAAEEAEEEMAAVEETAAVEERAEEEEEKPVAPSAGASRGPGERHEPDPVPLVPAETLAPINVAPATAEDDPATKTPTPLREERPTALAAEAVAPQEEEGGEDAGMAEAEEAVDYGEAEMEATPEPKAEVKANAEGGAKQESKSRREEAKEPRSKRERHNDAAGLDRSDSGRRHQRIEFRPPGKRSDTTPEGTGTPTERRSSVFDRLGKPERAAAPVTRGEATQALLVMNFVRPFTLPALKELLGTFGELAGLWLPPIKDKAYVVFQEAEQAEACRVALTGIEWPQGNKNSLRPRFIAVEEAEAVIKAGVELPRKSSGVGGAAAAKLLTTAPKEAPAANGDASTPKAVEKKPEPKKELGLDDLFRKTTAEPQIYWLPLTEAQRTAKLAREREKSKEKDGGPERDRGRDRGRV